MQLAKWLLYFLVIAQIECVMAHSPLTSVPRRPEMMSNGSVKCLMTWLKETAQMVTMWPGHLHIGDWPCCRCFWFQMSPTRIFSLSLESCSIHKHTHTPHYAPIHTQFLKISTSFPCLIISLIWNKRLFSNFTIRPHKNVYDNLSK